MAQPANVSQHFTQIWLNLHLCQNSDTFMTQTVTQTHTQIKKIKKYTQTGCFEMSHMKDERFFDSKWAQN